MQEIDISIIIPCYNEGNKLTNNIPLVYNYLDNLNVSYEIICVNDGSTDLETQNIVSNITFKNTKFISYQKNRGKGYAVKQGLEAAIGNTILFMDADLSVDLFAIKMALKYKDYDVVIGSRRHHDSMIPKPQGPVRKFIGICCIILTRLITGIKVKDTQCGFKSFKKDIAKQLISKQTIDRWAFDVEYLYIATLNNFSIKEIPVIWENDEDSRVSPIKSSISFFKELIKISKNKYLYKIG